MGIARRGKKGLFQHFRRAPKRYALVESRVLVRTAMHTTDENLARNKAAQIENLQDLQWEALLAGRATEATVQYEKLRALAEARGVTYLPALEVAKLSVEAILERVEEAGSNPAPADALLGQASPPPVTVSQLFEIYAELVADQLQGKSTDQIKRWAAPRKKSTRNLVAVVGDVDIRSVANGTISTPTNPRHTIRLLNQPRCIGGQSGSSGTIP